MEENVPLNTQNQLSTNPQEKPASKRKKIFGLVLILAVLNILVFGGLYLSTKNRGEGNTKNPSNPGSQIEATPTPFPFQEITIPYLRNRTYDSTLGELTVNSENAEYISYQTSYESDSNTIYGQLTVPTGDGPEGGWPAIVFVHGYIPPASYETFENYASYVDYLASNGFVVFKIDLRGHGNSEGEPGGAYYSSDYIVDVLNAYSALQKSEYVNPEKIGLWGHSMAGNVTSRALAVKPDIPAISIWAGAVYTYTDLAEYMIQDSSYQPPSDDSPSRRKRAEMIAKYGQFDPESWFWKQVPMTNYLGDIKGAIQLNHAIDDDVVNIGYSRNFDSILDKTKIPHELNEYSSGGHNFIGGTFSEAMRTTVEFFDRHLN
jgi:uncharacterized protein